MAKQKKVIGSVHLSTDQPTKLTFDDLHNWVIWQFPRPKTNHFCGAVRPPIPNHGWLPALINSNKRRVVVHGELDKVFDTPEAAADWLATSKNHSG